MLLQKNTCSRGGKKCISLLWRTYNASQELWQMKFLMPSCFFNMLNLIKSEIMLNYNRMRSKVWPMMHLRMVPRNLPASWNRNGGSLPLPMSFLEFTHHMWNKSIKRYLVPKWHLKTQFCSDQVKFLCFLSKERTIICSKRFSCPVFNSFSTYATEQGLCATSWVQHTIYWLIKWYSSK